MEVKTPIRPAWASNIRPKKLFDLRYSDLQVAIRMIGYATAVSKQRSFDIPSMESEKEEPSVPSHLPWKERSLSPAPELAQMARASVMKLETSARDLAPRSPFITNSNKPVRRGTRKSSSVIIYTI